MAETKCLTGLKIQNSPVTAVIDKLGDENQRQGPNLEIEEITTRQEEKAGKEEGGNTHMGKDIVDVVEDRLSVESITAQATSPTSGAIALFVGTTRDNFEGKQVLRLEYEAYMPMARKKMLETCQLVRTKWSVENIVMVHRIGVVPVGEASIVIAVASPHRQEALEAVHFAIDHVKATVPIWKKEMYGDDTSSWKQNKECSWSSDLPPGS